MNPLLLGFVLTFLWACPADGQLLRHLNTPASPTPEETVRAFLGSVCSHIVSDPDLPGFFGCETCPSFTGFKGEPFHWDLVAIYNGHFTDTKSHQATVAMTGCEPLSLKFGGTALLTLTAAGWKLDWYQPDLITSDCMSVTRRDGLNSLVCADEDGSQGAVFYTLSAIDLNSEPQSREGVLLNIFDNTPSCGLDYAGGTDAISPVQKARFQEVRFDPDKAKLQVQVEFGRRPYTKDDMRRCTEADRAHMPIPQSLQPRTNNLTMSFHFDGSRFNLEPQSERTKQIVESRPTSNPP